MDLRNGKSIDNFHGMFPMRPTSAPTTSIGATPTAPSSVRLQGLQKARRILSILTSSPSTGTPSPNVPARPSNGAVGSTSNYIVSSSALSPSVNSASSLPHYTCSSSITAPPQEVRHAPNVINKLSQYHQAKPASQWWSLFMAMVVYFNMSESAALSAFPFYLRNIPKQWYFQLNDLIKSSLESLKNSFLERFQKQKNTFLHEHIKQVTVTTYCGVRLNVR